MTTTEPTPQVWKGQPTPPLSLCWYWRDDEWVLYYLANLQPGDIYRPLSARRPKDAPV